METIFFQKTKTSYRLRAKKVFVFFKKTKYFSQKKRVSKLSVFENGHFWLCPHIRLTSRTFPSPHGNKQKMSIFEPKTIVFSFRSLILSLCQFMYIILSILISLFSKGGGLFLILYNCVICIIEIYFKVFDINPHAKLTSTNNKN